MCKVIFIDFRKDDGFRTMESFLDEVTVSNTMKGILRKENLNSARDVIATPNYKFLSYGAKEEEIRILKNAAAKFVSQKFLPASELFSPKYAHKWLRISFACKAIDECTRGGILTRGITEICGESGAGKTQLLLQLCLTVQLPTDLGGLGRGVAFISTEDDFPSKRLMQMIGAFEKKYPHLGIEYGSKIFIERVLESETLIKCVSVRLANLMRNEDVGLIIIDSVAAVFRTNSNIIKRAKEMRTLASELLLLGDQHNCAIVCVNQVATVDSEKPSVPCLGFAWAHLGRTRLKVSKVPKQVIVDNQLSTVRKLEIMYSPETPNEVCEFLITSKGICDLK